jgi:hypothetical protein
MSQNVTVQQGSCYPMPTDRTEPVTDQAATSAAKPESRALVPSATFIERRARRRWYRWAPDPIFVTHLIAQAERVPQVRDVRRASMADAQAAYRPHPAPPQGVGSRMRQVV